MDFVIPAPEQPSLAVAGSAARFPVRRIYCVGRNYAEHAREMGADPVREPPFFFMKPADAILPDGAEVPYPPGTDNLHHEVELVAALGAGGRDIDPAKALDLVWGYAVGNDLTRRDLQGQAKAAGKPWEVGKGFDHSAPVSPLRPVAEVGHPTSGLITLSVNGERRQTGDLSDMTWSVAEVIAHLSRLFHLHAGDLIFTGTPAGVGPVRREDVMVAEIAGIGTLTNRIA
ncbi:fumarylacetoacetate hydrolase family protein [Aerophototrophica crusticola]|uniref:Fumarylacetoacetate hydrolase family protein n=1 Tax=Aerophototrophica crusticola TaxID=1709002 RepID=A0A858R758_9PROT|nr:fumarylacetoacetate hydrolase family protein [Rhodospirillaceae bacterium B3]